MSKSFLTSWRRPRNTTEEANHGGGRGNLTLRPGWGFLGLSSPSLICKACQSAEERCFPLKKKDNIFKPRWDFFETFGVLEASAQTGCVLCRVWRKALLTMCFSRLDVEGLVHRSDEPVRAELRSSPAKIILTCGPVTATVFLLANAIQKDQSGPPKGSHFSSLTRTHNVLFACHVYTTNGGYRHHTGS